MTNNICIKAGFNNEDVALQFSIREISMTDYFRSEASSPVVHYASAAMQKTMGAEADDVLNYDDVTC